MKMAVAIFQIIVRSNTGLSTTSDGDRSYGRKESFVLISDEFSLRLRIQLKG